MKRIVLIGCLILSSIAFTQIPKGVKFISGQIGYASLKSNSGLSETRSLNIIPTFGYFFAPNWAIAGSFGYKHATAQTKQVENSSIWQSSQNTSSAIAITPSLRKFWVLNERLSVFGQLDFPLEFGKINNKTDDRISREETSTAYFSYGISLKPGLDYFLNRNWKIVSTIGEISYLTNKKEKDKEAATNFRIGLYFSSVSFGIKYILPPKK